MENFTEEQLQIPACTYEYLDHPADIQIHSWGSSLKDAFEQSAVAMYGYMTELDKVDINITEEIEVEQDDLDNMLFHFLDECLFVFCVEPYIIGKKVVITEFDKVQFKLKATIYGEEFDLQKHPQGTEVKAITYSNMQIYDKDNQYELFVIIDI